MSDDAAPGSGDVWKELSAIRTNQLFLAQMVLRQQRLSLVLAEQCLAFSRMLEEAADDDGELHGFVGRLERELEEG